MDTIHGKSSFPSDLWTCNLFLPFSTTPWFCFADGCVPHAKPWVTWGVARSGCYHGHGQCLLASGTGSRLWYSECRRKDRRGRLRCGDVKTRMHMILGWRLLSDRRFKHEKRFRLKFTSWKGIALYSSIAERSQRTLKLNATLHCIGHHLETL